MIVRLMGEGQFRIDDALATELNRIDALFDDAMEHSSGTELAEALGAMADMVRDRGTPLAVEDIVPSDAILPPAGVSLEELRLLVGEDGLIPGSDEA